MPLGCVWFAYHPNGMLARLGRVLGDDGPMGRSLGVVLLAAAWVATWRPQVDPDAWWHIAIGKTILASGAIPRVEPFSWLTQDAPFVAHSWSWDVLLATASGLGMAGTSLLVLPVTAAIVWVSWVLIGIAAPGIAPVPRAFLVLTAVAASLPLWAPRSGTLDVLFVLSVAVIVASYLRHGTRRWLPALPLIAVLWANLHGSAILGLVALLVVAIFAVRIGERWGTWPGRSLRPLALAGIAAVLAACVNPYGPALLAYPFDREVASAFSVDIIEWRSPDFGARELVFARIVLAAVLLLAAAWPRRGRDPFLLLAAAAWTFAALGAVRFLPIAAFLIVAAAAPAFGPAMTRWLGSRGLRADGGGHPPTTPAPVVLAAGVAARRHHRRRRVVHRAAGPGRGDRASPPGRRSRGPRGAARARAGSCRRTAGLAMSSRSPAARSAPTGTRPSDHSVNRQRPSRSPSTRGPGSMPAGSRSRSCRPRVPCRTGSTRRMTGAPSTATSRRRSTSAPMGRLVSSDRRRVAPAARGPIAGTGCRPASMSRATPRSAGRRTGSCRRNRTAVRSSAG